MSHDLWMHQRLIPAGGVMPAHFTDASYTQVYNHDGSRDPAIWTCANLAAQALCQAPGDLTPIRGRIDQVFQLVQSRTQADFAEFRHPGHNHELDMRILRLHV